MRLKLLMLSLLLFVCCGSGWGQTDAAVVDTAFVDTAATVPPPAPISGLTGYDKPNDHGHAITLEWELSPDDGAVENPVLQYEVFRWIPSLNDVLEAKRVEITEARTALDAGENTNRDWKSVLRVLLDDYDKLMDSAVAAHEAYPKDGEWRSIGIANSGVATYHHLGTKDILSVDYLPDHADLYYRVDAVTADPEVRSQSEIFGPVQCYGQWFNTGRIPVFVAVIVFGFLTILLVSKARKGADLYVRPIGGIEAVDDAIGRATEMGRPILYVLGLGTAADVATIASFTILGRVAKRVAEYQTELIVPTYDPIVMSVAPEVVKSAYFDAGRPDDYNEDIVFFVTQSQFAYVAAVNGIMLRQLPATNIYMGMFHAESLLLAETGTEAGSIQIAGTDQIAQLPFFIVACDYTLIGEELYAASAYLGREPILLGSLKAQDIAKAALLILAIVGLVAANFDFTGFTDLFRVTD